MLRKIVNMLMGASDDEVIGGQTVFERLLSGARQPALDRITPDVDAVEVLAQEVMKAALEGGTANPQAARAYFSVLVENDRLPEQEQLDDAELSLLKNLLAEYFSGNDAVRARANEVLALIERKFTQGSFTQAKILLQIFETDNETRLNNERNLFYEDMIMRLGMRRRHEVPDEEKNKLKALTAELSPEDGDEIRSSLVWFANEFYVQFCLLVRNPEEHDAWDDVKGACNEDSALRLARYVPSLRWRSPAALPNVTPIELTQLHLTDDAVKTHIQRLIKMCYFLLLASGDTGFEEFVSRFLSWSRDRLGVEGLTILPVIHRSSVLDELGLQDTLDSIYENYYADPLAKLLDRSQESLGAAWTKVIRGLGELDVDDIPPGHYDLGGFILDALLEFTQPEPYFGFKLYRLT